MLGILCEKPSAARNFAKALGGMNGTYDNTPYQIVAARGHLYEFTDPSKMVASSLVEKYGQPWKIENLPWDETDFNWKREKKKDTAQTLKDIQTVLMKCDEIAIATDVDPTGEGELLAWEVLDELGLKPKKWSRFYFIDEAPASIQKAFKTRKAIPSMLQDPDYLKAYYRSKWDFMSMQFTRIATCYTGKVLRQGRLKSAMVRIVGEGLDAVANYKKIPFYQWRFKDENQNVFTDPNEMRHPKKEGVPNPYVPATVVVDSTEDKSKTPPKMLDLAALSAELAKDGFKAKQVLDVYQKMYEDQVVSYPRTEDKVITPEQFDELLPFVDRIAKVVGVDPAILTHRTPRSTHVKTGGAHGANRPGTNVPASLDALSKYGSCARNIYEILARNYLATLCEDYIYIHQEGHLKEYPTFKGSANQPKAMGWKLVFAGTDDDDDTNGKLLGTKASPFLFEGFPTKPPTPTVKWLMKQLEKHDVGTGATRTSTYAEVSNEKSATSLLKENRSKITLTELGRMSYLILPGTHIGSLDITEKVYADMREIAAGKTTAEKCLTGIRQLVLDDIETMKTNLTKVKAEFDLSASDKEYATGVYGPSGTEVKFNRVWSGHRFTDDEVSKLLNGEEIAFTVTYSSGQTGNVSGKLAEQTYKGNKYWGFAKADAPLGDDRVEGYFKPKKKKIRFKREWGGHKFTDDEVAKLLNGDTISFEAVSKNTGNTYTATGKLQEQKYNGNKFWGFGFVK